MTDKIADIGAYPTRAPRSTCAARNICATDGEAASLFHKAYRREHAQRLNTIVMLLIAGWQEQRHTVDMILQKEGFTCISWGDLSELQISGEYKDHTLILTDSAAMAAVYCQKGFVCVGCAGECAETEGHFFEGAGLVLEDPEALDIPYMEEYLCHMLGEAVQVAETPRLILKEISPDEIDGLCAISRQCDSRFLLNPEAEDFFTREQMLAYVNQAYRLCGYGLWSVLLKGDNQREQTLIGCCGLSDVRRDSSSTVRVELQYMLGEKYRRHGYGCEMCREVLKLAAERAGCSAVWLRIHPDNLPSLKLAKKLGFHREAEEAVGRGDGSRAGMLLFSRSVGD